MAPKKQLVSILRNSNSTTKRNSTTNPSHLNNYSIQSGLDPGFDDNDLHSQTMTQRDDSSERNFEHTIAEYESDSDDLTQLHDDGAPVSQLNLRSDLLRSIVEEEEEAENGNGGTQSGIHSVLTSDFLEAVDDKKLSSNGFEKFQDRSQNLNVAETVPVTSKPKGAKHVSIRSYASYEEISPRQSPFSISDSNSWNTSTSNNDTIGALGLTSNISSSSVGNISNGSSSKANGDNSGKNSMKKPLVTQNQTQKTLAAAAVPLSQVQSQKPKQRPLKKLSANRSSQQLNIEPKTQTVQPQSSQRLSQTKSENQPQKVQQLYYIRTPDGNLVPVQQQRQSQTAQPQPQIQYVTRVSQPEAGVQYVNSPQPTQSVQQQPQMQYVSTANIPQQQHLNHYNDYNIQDNHNHNNIPPSKRDRRQKSNSRVCGVDIMVWILGFFLIMAGFAFIGYVFRQNYTDVSEVNSKSNTKFNGTNSKPYNSYSSTKKPPKKPGPSYNIPFLASHSSDSGSRSSDLYWSFMDQDKMKEYTISNHKVIFPFPPNHNVVNSYSKNLENFETNITSWPQNLAIDIYQQENFRDFRDLDNNNNNNNNNLRTSKSHTKVKVALLIPANPTLPGGDLIGRVGDEFKLDADMIHASHILSNSQNLVSGSLDDTVSPIEYDITSSWFIGSLKKHLPKFKNWNVEGSMQEQSFAQTMYRKMLMKKWGVKSLKNSETDTTTIQGIDYSIDTKNLNSSKQHHSTRNPSSVYGKSYMLENQYITRKKYWKPLVKRLGLLRSSEDEKNGIEKAKMKIDLSNYNLSNDADHPDHHDGTSNSNIVTVWRQTYESNPDHDAPDMLEKRASVSTLTDSKGELTLIERPESFRKQMKRLDLGKVGLVWMTVPNVGLIDLDFEYFVEALKYSVRAGIDNVIESSYKNIDNNTINNIVVIIPKIKIRYNNNIRYNNIDNNKESTELDYINLIVRPVLNEVVGRDGEKRGEYLSRVIVPEMPDISVKEGQVMPPW